MKLRIDRRSLCAALVRMGTLLCLAGPARADSGDGFLGGKGWFGIGWAGLDIDPLRDELVAAGYPRLSSDFLSLGGGGYFMWGRLLLGGHGDGYISDDREVTRLTGPYEITLTGGSGFFDVGYAIVRSGGLDLAPMIGLGGGGYLLEIEDRDSVTFGQVLQDPGRSSHLAIGGFLIDFAASLEYHFRFGDDGDDEAHGGPLVGIRAGYTIAPWVSDWTLERREISGGPEVGVEGPYVRVVVGGWGGH